MDKSGVLIELTPCSRLHNWYSFVRPAGEALPPPRYARALGLRALALPRHVPRVLQVGLAPNTNTVIHLRGMNNTRVQVNTSAWTWGRKPPKP